MHTHFLTRIASAVLGLAMAAPAFAAVPTQAPTNYTINQTGPQSVTVSWSPVPSATRYITRISGTAIPTREVRTTNTSVTLRGLNTIPYTITTRGQNLDGSGPVVSANMTPSARTLSGPPSGISVTNAGKSASIRWASLTNAVSYIVTLQDATTSAMIGTVTTSTLMASFPNLTVGTSYTATITAVANDGSTTSAATTFTAAALVAPSAMVTGLTVTPLSGTSATTTWSPVAGASAYQVYVGTNPSTLSSQRAVFTANTTLLINGLTSGTQYYVMMRPLNQSGTGPFNTPVPFLSLVAPGAPTLTMTPGILSATATWNTVGSASSYSLYYMTGSFSKPSATLLSNVTSPTVLPDLAPQAYSFAASASNAAGEGALSAVQTATPTDLSVPANLMAEGSNAAVNAQWGSVSGATSYEIGYSAGSAFNAGSATIVPSPSTTNAISGLTNGQTYAIAARGVLGSARSGWSTSVTATPNPATTILYRDAVALYGIQTPSDCSGSYYTGWMSWFYLCPTETPRATIMANGYNGATPLPTMLNRLQTGTYNVWLYGGAQMARTLQVSHDTSVLTMQFTTNAYSWIKAGSMAIDPSKTLSIASVSESPSSLVGVYLRGMYLTQGDETPTVQPAGSGGDQVDNFGTPTNLVLAGQPGAMQLSWNAAPNALSYKVYYTTGTGAFSKASATVVSGLSGTTTTLSDLGNNLQVNAAISAVYANGESLLSAVVTSTTGSLTPPSSVTAVGGDGSISLSWSPVSGISSYLVSYHQGTIFNSASVTTTIPVSSGTTLNITGLTNGTAYAVSVQSVFNSATSAYSTGITATPSFASFYRDARDLTGILTGCFNGRWEFSGFPGCSTSSYNAGLILVAEAPSSVAITTSLSGSLPSGTYSAWAYMGRNQWAGNSIPSLRINHNSTSISGSASLPSGSYSWVKIGTLTLDPTKTLSFDALNVVSGMGLYVYGVYFTSGTDTPTCVPTGKNGDQSNITCPL